MKPRDVGTWRDTWADVRRSFADFLAVPSATVAAFLLLAVGTYLLDRHTVGWLEPTRSFLKHRLITDPDTTDTLLGAIAGGGKGAAIGAGSGAAAGAVTQVVTKGSIKVPAETVLTFKLDSPLRVREAR